MNQSEQENPNPITGLNSHYQDDKVRRVSVWLDSIRHLLPNSNLDPDERFVGSLEDWIFLNSEDENSID